MDTQQTTVTTPRGLWAAALAALAPQPVIDLAAELARTWRVELRTVPQAGLTMLCLRESLYGEDFYLGELPLAVAEVDLVLPSGQRYPGAAQVMSDSLDLGLAIAVCDAVLAHGLPGYQRVAAAVAEGQQQRAAAAARRRAMLAATLVSFAELAEAGSTEGEA